LKHKKLLGLGVILVVLLLSVSYVVDPDFFGRIANLGKETTVSISQINVDPQGSIVGDEYKGSFWNILAYINANDYLAGVVLPKGQTGSVTYQGAIKALETGAKVEIKIDPQTPYLIRSVQEKQVMYAPSVVGAGSTVDASYLRYYDWSEPTWRIYTPFTVTIYKDGVQVGQATLNMQGQSQVQTVSTSEGAVRIENLGILGGQYLSPNTPSQIAILKGYSNVYDWVQIQNIVNGAQPGSVAGSSASKYADYWFGTARDSSNRAINPVVTMGVSQTNVYAPSAYGGWSGNDFGGQAKPVKPVVGSSDKSSLPVDERSFYSLTEFIEQAKGISNLASSLFNSKATGSAGALWQEVSFVTDTNGQTALKLTIPWSAFGAPLVSIRVPTELADTWVEQPQIANAQVSASWVSTGTKYCNVFGSNRIAVQVTNVGSTTASSRLTIQSGNSKLSVTPLSMTVNNLEPSVPQTVFFDATNLGVESETSDIPITIIAYDTYTNTETSRTTVYGTLKPTLTTGVTTFKLFVVEKGTSNLIVGLPLTVQYGNQAPSVFTDSNGLVSLTLTTPQGGAFTGQVYVQSDDTTVYKTASATYNLPSATAYEFTLEVERKDTDYPSPEGFNWLTIALIIGVIALIVAIIVLVVYFKKRRRR